jgi:hypothetical protein
MLDFPVIYWFFYYAPQKSKNDMNIFIYVSAK